MNTHTLIYVSDTDYGVTFQCSICGRQVEFVHPTYGYPNPIPDGSGGWLPADNPEIWMGDCE